MPARHADVVALTRRSRPARREGVALRRRDSANENDALHEAPKRVASGPVDRQKCLAAVLGFAADPASLARIEIRSIVGGAAQGAPEVFVDGDRVRCSASLTDRAGWAVCAIDEVSEPSAATWSWWSPEAITSCRTSSHRANEQS